MNFIAVSVYQSEAHPDMPVYLNVDRIQCIHVIDKHAPRIEVGYEGRQSLVIRDMDSVDALLAAIGMEGSL